ncbi:hypothetical protein [Nocardia tengchongensis]|uniref:hypothetical protein n=1 Tax=Nocardia tengchongensis TaxID=2055889 RepID=UPI00365A3BBC
MDSLHHVNGWALALLAYVIAAVGSFVPAANRLFGNTQLKPGGPSFDASPHFSDAAKQQLTQNYERIAGTLMFWKTRAARYEAVHTYLMFWMALAAVAVPILAQNISDTAWSKWLVTIVSGHAALLLVMVRSFRVEANYRAFRDGESSFYDLYRKMLDRPEVFGSTEEIQLRVYFEQVELTRKFVRAAEIDNFPSVEDLNATLPSGER